MDRNTPISRRSALALLLGAGASALVPNRAALAVTQDDVDKTEAQLAEAKRRYKEVKAQLDQIAEDYEQLSQELAETLASIDVVTGEVDKTEQQIADKEAELEEKRDTLARRARSAYKAGGDEVLAALLAAQSFEELDANIYYLDKISENDRQLIEDIKALKAELEQHREELVAKREELEALKAEQEAKLKEMQERQEEVQTLLDGLDEDVQKLVSRRDKELLALAREREEQKKREEEAQKAADAAAKDSSSGSAANDVTGSYQDGTTSGSQAAIVSSCKSTGSPGAGLCAMWVSMVFSNAGYAYAGGNANDMYNWWTSSSNRSDLRPGMIVAVSTHSHTSAGRIYGHIGIYIGDGMMMDNIGSIRTISVNEWIRYYSTTVTPRWGWLMGIELSA